MLNKKDTTHVKKRIYNHTFDKYEIPFVYPRTFYCQHIL